LELEQNTIPNEIEIELDVKAFLSLFEMNLPLIPRTLLRPLKKEEGLEHFAKLKALAAHLMIVDSDLPHIVKDMAELPFIDHIIAAYEAGSLQPAHLQVLGIYIEKNLGLLKYEKKFALDSKGLSDSMEILKILKRHTRNNFGEILLFREEKELQGRIKTANKEIVAFTKKMEKDVQKAIGMGMNHPWPKELPPDTGLLPKIKACDFLKVSKKNDLWFVEWVNPSALRKMTDELQRLEKLFTEEMNRRLKRINAELKAFTKDFCLHVRERKERTYHYALLNTLKKAKLSLPVFSDNPGLVLSKAALPSLQTLRKETYVPLDVNINKGANVLFGANMSGKTTVLKTTYFHLKMIQLGLPVPAVQVQTSYPEHVFFHLKNSGNLVQGLSGFGEEMNFFSNVFPSGSFILTDEMFHSTNPVSGTELSIAFLEEFSSRPCIFLCTTQYPGALEPKNISLLHMKDVDYKALAKEKLSLASLLEKVPYKVESISSDKVAGVLKEGKNALYLALHFPLDERFKEKIRSRL
jgi:hypothetical protein